MTTRNRNPNIPNYRQFQGVTALLVAVAASQLMAQRRQPIYGSFNEDTSRRIKNGDIDQALMIKGGTYANGVLMAAEAVARSRGWRGTSAQIASIVRQLKVGKKGDVTNGIAPLERKEHLIAVATYEGVVAPLITDFDTKPVASYFRETPLSLQLSVAKFENTSFADVQKGSRFNIMAEDLRTSATALDEFYTSNPSTTDYESEKEIFGNS